MRNLLALLLFVPSLCLAQVPTYVPTDGLVGWWPFEGNADDLSGFANHGVPAGAWLTTDRFGQDSAAFFFDGEGAVSISHSPSITPTSAVTISCWFKPEEHTIQHGASLVSKGLETQFWNYGSHILPNGIPAFAYTYFSIGSGSSISSNNWTHLVFTVDADLNEMVQYTNGVAETSMFNLNSMTPTANFSNILNSCCSAPLEIGRNAGGSNGAPFHGTIDDVAIWNRALDSIEVMALFLGDSPIFGCTDLAACNYDSSATADNGSCQYGCLYCGEGTVWDSTLHECVGIVPPPDSILVPIPSCGEGTIWDPVNEECIIAIPADLNYDGCVSVNDLLVLLAVHGTCPPYPEWPDEPTDTTWACGDPLTYWDYDYTTVLIGDQCWFAENLRTASYLNGDGIPEPSNQDEWATLLLGMSTVYGSDDHTCYSAWNFDACDDSLALEVYGRLYNWWAVDDSRGLCPSEWHVASNQEWFELENHAAQNGFNGIEATALQSTSGWGVTGNGTDDFGFAAKPGGHCDFGGTYFYAGNRGKWWTSTYENGSGRYWYSTHMDPEIHSAVDTPKYGFSVRCIKD